MERKKTIIEDISSLDSLSIGILIALFIREKVRFNELERIMKETGRKFSRPTLVAHLKTLMDKQMILREEEGVQKVTYRINEKRYKINKEMKEEYNKIIQYYAKIYVTDKDMTKLEGIDWFIHNALVAYLYKLKLLITLELPPINLPEDEIYPIRAFFSMPYEDALLNNCIVDEEYKKNTLQRIDELIKSFMVKIDESG